MYKRTGVYQIAKSCIENAFFVIAKGCIENASL